MNTIKDEFEKFADIVIDKDAPQIQHDEMKLAYYAGAFSTLMLIVIGSPSLSEDASFALLMSWVTECSQYIRSRMVEDDNTND